MNTLQNFESDFFDRVRSHPESENLRAGATEAELRDLKLALSSQLPESYLEFLSQINGGNIGLTLLFGANRDKPLDFKKELLQLGSFIPPIAGGTMIPFATDWGGNFYCFDTYHPHGNGEYTIWRWNHEYSEEPADAPYV